jgi:hypothetical protein
MSRKPGTLRLLFVRGPSTSRRITSQRRVFALAMGLVVNGCAQGSPAIPAHSFGGSTALPPAVHGYGNDSMYSSQPSGNEVAVYRREGSGLTLKFKKMLTAGLSAPMGMITTPDGRLYVANSGDSDVLVYRSSRKGPEGPIATLRDDGNLPVNVAATPNRRLVAVSNASNTSGGAGSVSVYLNRKDKPSRVLTYGSDPIQGQGIAIDSSGNCYWSFNDPATLTGSIVEFAGCNGNGVLFKSGILDAGGMAFDQSGDLFYVDQPLGIYRCDGGSCGIWLSVSGLGGLILPKNINFDNSSPQNLWIADGAGYIDAANLDGVIVYILQAIGGVTDPPFGIAPAPGN